MVSAAFGLLGTVEGGAGAGAGFECVPPAPGGWAPTDLPLDLGAFETAAGDFAEEFTVLADAGLECALVPAGSAFALPTAAAVFFAGDDGALDAAPLAGAGAAEAAFATGRTSADVVRTISMGALDVT